MEKKNNEGVDSPGVKICWKKDIEECAKVKVIKWLEMTSIHFRIYENSRDF